MQLVFILQFATCTTVHREPCLLTTTRISQKRPDCAGRGEIWESVPVAEKYLWIVRETSNSTNTSRSHTDLLVNQKIIISLTVESRDVPGVWSWRWASEWIRTVGSQAPLLHSYIRLCDLPRGWRGGGRGVPTLSLDPCKQTYVPSPRRQGRRQLCILKRINVPKLRPRFLLHYRIL